MAKAPTPVATPLYTDSNHRINLIVTDPSTPTGRANITGKSLKLLVDDPSGTVFEYDGVIDNGAVGEAHFNLNGTNHGTVGGALLQVHIDGIPKGEFTVQFDLKLAA